MRRRYSSIAIVICLALPTALAAQPVREPASAQPGKSVEAAAAKGILSLFGSKQSADAKAMAAAANVLDGAYQGQRPPEAVRMLAAVLRGSQMGPGEGWFGPAESRYSWKWLATHCQADPSKGGISRRGFPGMDAWFARLDRDKNGVITPLDLDWSDRNPYIQMSYMVNALFRKLNTQGDGQLTREEMLQFFQKAANGKDHLSADDFRDALLSGIFGSSRPAEGPKPEVLIRGLFSGELGSMNEGPKLNAPAPDFTLKTADGKDTVHLAKLIGPKPIVLVFGSFT